MTGRHGDAIDGTRTPRFRFLRKDRGKASAPASQLLTAPVTALRLPDLADISDTGNVTPVTAAGTGPLGWPLVRDAIGVRPATGGEMVGEFTGIIRAYEDEAEPISEEDFARPATGATREVEAAERIVAGRADLARIYVPAAINAIPLGVWDTPANREPMRYVPDLPADLTDLPEFREALRVHTRSGPVPASGCGPWLVDGQTWGERMVAAAGRLLVPQATDTEPVPVPSPPADTETSGTEPEPDPGTPEPPEVAAAMEACDALNPVPAEMAGEDATA
jgi:hypothetical protein